MATSSASPTDVFTAGLDGIVCGYNSKERNAMSKTQFKVTVSLTFYDRYLIKIIKRSIFLIVLKLACDKY